MPTRAQRRNSIARPDAIARRERDLKCVQMRIAGAQWHVIASALGYSCGSHAHRRFVTFMKDYPRHDIEEARELELARLDELMFSLWPEAIDVANTKTRRWATERCLQIINQRALLLGLNRPVAQTVEVITQDDVNDAIKVLTEEMSRRAEETGVPVPEVECDDADA